MISKKMLLRLFVITQVVFVLVFYFDRHGSLRGSHALHEANEHLSWQIAKKEAEIERLNTAIAQASSEFGKERIAREDLHMGHPGKEKVYYYG